jgi:hypothetical protein
VWLIGVDYIADGFVAQTGIWRTKMARFQILRRLLGVAFMAMFALGIVARMQPRYFTASDLPASDPSEANRVRHPAGYSIVAPVGWQVRVIAEGEDTDRIEIWSRPEGRGMVYGTYLSISDDNGNGGERHVLPDGSAWRIYRDVQPGAFPDSPTTTKIILSPEESKRGQVTVRVSRDCDALPVELLPYIASARFDEGE